MPPLSRARPRLSVVGAALLFSTGGVAIKMCSLSPWQVASFRSGVAALAAVWLLPGALRRWSWRTLLVAAAYAACLTLFVAANKLTTAASTIFLQSTAPLYILALGRWLLCEPVRARDLGAMAAVAAGLALFFVGTPSAQATAPNPIEGNVLAAASGVAWALTVVGLRWAATDGGREGGSAAAAVLAGNALAFLVGLPPALPVEAVTPQDALVIAYLGIFQIALAYRLLASGLQGLTAFEASLLLLVEPVLNPLWTWLVHGETPGGLALLGGALILGATIWKSWRDAREPS